MHDQGATIVDIVTEVDLAPPVRIDPFIAQTLYFSRYATVSLGEGSNGSSKM